MLEVHRHSVSHNCALLLCIVDKVLIIAETWVSKRSETVNCVNKLSNLVLHNWTGPIMDIDIQQRKYSTLILFVNGKKVSGFIY